MSLNKTKQIAKTMGLFFGLLLLLPSCGSKGKTERMAAVLDEVRAKYKAYEDISNDDQILRPTLIS